MNEAIKRMKQEAKEQKAKELKEAINREAIKVLLRLNNVKLGV